MNRFKLVNLFRLLKTIMQIDVDPQYVNLDHPLEVCLEEKVLQMFLLGDSLINPFFSLTPRSNVTCVLKITPSTSCTPNFDDNIIILASNSCDAPPTWACGKSPTSLKLDKERRVIRLGESLLKHEAQLSGPGPKQNFESQLGQ